MPGCEIRHAKTVAWSNDMECHAKKCVERSCELANKMTESLCKVSTRCLDDQNFKKEDWKRLEKLSNACSQTVLKMLVLGKNW